MASLESDILPREIAVEKCTKEARNIVFSLPELSRDEQAARLLASVTTDVSGITLEIAEQAIDNARMTY